MTRAPTPLERIRLLILDVDGVLTDGRLYYNDDGESQKVFHVRDGHGLKQLRTAGIDIAVISGRTHAAVTKRCQELGIAHVEQGCDNKRAAFDRLVKNLKLDPAYTLCVVDDSTDIDLMCASGYCVAVADAHPDVLAIADRITTKPGGQGAVREVCDWLLANSDTPSSP